ncbi:hypothetical protein Tco_1259539 [Tanacetum coccineum]
MSSFPSKNKLRAFNINEPIYAKLCHEFYSTYEFDEVCADDELQTKKIIKFRLGGRAHSLTLLEFARRLGLYQAVELEEDGFNESYFYYQETNFEGDPQNDHLWFFQRTTGFGDCEMDAEERSWDSERESNFLWDLDITTFRDLIDSYGKLIPEDPQPGVPRVGIPRPPRASMQDLYNRMSRMEIRQEVIERMEYRQSYHWDRYQGVFEHMDVVYSVLMHGAYNLPGSKDVLKVNHHLHHFAGREGSEALLNLRKLELLVLL